MIVLVAALPLWAESRRYFERYVTLWLRFAKDFGQPLFLSQPKATAGLKQKIDDSGGSHFSQGGVEL